MARAYTQSLLKTKVPTFVELPLGAAVRTVRLVRALYGHPESGWRWDEVQRNFELYERRSLR